MGWLYLNLIKLIFSKNINILLSVNIFKILYSNFFYVVKYTELDMYFNNQDFCYFHLTIIQLEIGIGISWIGPISVPRVTFDIATSQHGDRIRGDILVQSYIICICIFTNSQSDRVNSIVCK